LLVIAEPDPAINPSWQDHHACAWRAGHFRL